jgi:5'-deoxynucleotidase YfbR-like HD superfamily hydrolase
MQERIMQVSRFVHDYLMKTGKDHENEPWGPKYRWEHTLRVAHWAWILAKEEKADIEQNVIAALFHDVSHFAAEDYRTHGEKSAEIAVDFMVQAGFPKDFAEDVSYAVKSHVGERDPKTVQAKILQDADTLDRFGHFRILLFGKTADLSNLETVKADIQSLLTYFEKVQSGDFGPMWTATGKEKVKTFLTVSKAVYGEILAEIANTMSPEIYV